MFLGVVMSLSISPAMAKRIGIANYHFTFHHIFFLSIGFLIMVFCSMLSKNAILNISYIGYIFCFFLLIAVLFIGSNIKGSHRWINFGGFSIQPSELMKPFFIIINAHFLSIVKKSKNTSLFSILIFAVLIFLFILQPDFGTCVVYTSIWFIQIFLGNSNIRLLMYSFIPMCVIVAIIGFFFFPHFHYRIMTFLTLKKGHEQYQTKKAIESIYNGGLFGKGLGEGEVKYQLPDAHTDYIFSVICEELGIVFACILIFLIFIFAYRHIASNFMSNKYEIRVIYGLVCLFAIQSYIHIGVNIKLLPSKGMTFPFISYGGSSMIANSIIFGFLLAFTRKPYNYCSPYRMFENIYKNVIQGKRK